MRTTLRYSVKPFLVLLASTILMLVTVHVTVSTKRLLCRETSGHNEHLDCKSTFLQYNTDTVRVPDQKAVFKVNANHMQCSRGPPCRNFLTEFDQRMYRDCINGRVKKLLGPNVTILDNGCKFLWNQSRNAVALASFPGSGNTWLRTVIESTTGVCTGSYNCDMSLRYEGFSGENIRSGTVLMVKTHAFPKWIGDTPAKENEPIFHSAVVLIRNPFDALVSEWNRKISNNFSSITVRLGTHVARAGEQYFGRNKEWNMFVSKSAQQWKKMIEYWVVGGIKRRKKVLVVHYEDLKSNSEKTVSAVLNFLHVNVTDSEPTKHREQDNRFHRKHTQNDFDHFTRKQRKSVNRAIHETQYKLRMSGINHGVKNVVEEYVYNTL